MDATQNGCMINRPTIWYRLGFRYGWDESLSDWRDNDTNGFVPSALTTRITVRVNWLDRLRLLISGHCELTCYTKTDVVVNRAVTRSQFAVLPP